MSVYDLIENVIRMDEETAESSISYLPSTVGAVTSAIHSLVKSKQDWNVQFNEDKKHRVVSFEDSLKVNVPLQHWEGFSKAYGITKPGKTSLSHLLKGAIKEDITNYRQELKSVLFDFYNEESFDKVGQQTDLFRSFFGITEKYNTKTAVDVYNKEKDIQFIFTKLLKVYGTDKGELELLIAALREKRPLGAFEIFNKFDFLYGIKFLSTYKRVGITYESLIDMNYQFSQSISIDAKQFDIITKLEDLKDSSIKIVKNVIYPVGGIFTGRFYRQLKNTIKDNVD